MPEPFLKEVCARDFVSFLNENGIFIGPKNSPTPNQHRLSHCTHSIPRAANRGRLRNKII